MLYSVILIKVTPCRKVLQSWHEHSSFQDLILFLKPLRDVAVLIFIGMAFQVTTLKYLIEVLPINSVLTKGIYKVHLSLKSNIFLKSPTHRSLATLYISVVKLYIFWS